MDMPAAEARERRGRHSALKVLDCDVHPTVSGGMKSIYPYMSEAWARRFERKNASMASLALTTKYQHPNGSAIREDTRNEAGEVGGSDPRVVVSDPSSRTASKGCCSTRCRRQRSAVRSPRPTRASRSLRRSTTSSSTSGSRSIRACTTPWPCPRSILTPPPRRSAASDRTGRSQRCSIRAHQHPPGKPLLVAALRGGTGAGAADRRAPSGADSIYQGTPIAAGGIRILHRALRHALPDR